MKQAIDYENYYDDSSDEEDNIAIEANGIKWFEANLESASKLSSEIGVELIDLQLSFLAHEFGIRLIKSNQVNKKYYPLKKSNLANSSVLTEQQLETSITQSIQSALQQAYTEQLETLWARNNSSFQAFLEYICENKRTFIKAINTKGLQSILTHKLKDVALPSEEIQLDKNQLIDLTVEVFQESGVPITHNPGEHSKAKIKYGQKVKEKLAKYSPSSPVKQKITSRLLEVKSPISINTFVERNSSDLELVQNTTIHKFYDRLENTIYEIIKAASKDHVERTTLPNSYDLSFQKDCDMIEILSYVRLMTRSNIRLIKNLQVQDDIFGDQPKAVFRTIKFPSIETTVLESQEIRSNTGSRTDLIKTLASYQDIAKTMNVIKKSFQVKDSDIASWVTAILKNSWALPTNITINKIQQNQLEEFLVSVVYLLFGTEVARNPASLIIHHMLLELVQKASLSWAEAFGMASMPIKDAVSTSIWQHMRYPSSYKYSYDKRQEEISVSILKNFIEREASVFKSWLELKREKSALQITMPEFLKILITACKDWYKIDLETKQIMVDLVLHELDREELKADIKQLSTDDLVILKEICSDSSLKENLERLLDNHIQIELIIQIYKKSEEKFKHLSNQRILDLVSDSDSNVSFEEIIEAYDENQDKLFDLISDLQIIKDFGFEKVSRLYNKFSHLCDTDDIYQSVVAKLRSQDLEENGYDYNEYGSDTESASSENNSSLSADGYDSEYSSCLAGEDEYSSGYNSDY